MVISTQSYPALTNSGHLILADLAFGRISVQSWGTISRHYEDQEDCQLHVNLVNDRWAPARKAPGKYCNAYSVLLFALFSESSVHHGLWGNIGHRQWKKLGNEHAKEAREEARGRRKEIWCLCRRGYRAFRVRNCVDEYSFLLNLRQCLIGRSWSTGPTSLVRARKRFPGLEKAPSSRLSQPMSFIYYLFATNVVLPVYEQWFLWNWQQP